MSHHQRSTSAASRRGFVSCSKAQRADLTSVQGDALIIWITSNAQTFAIFDGFPVTHGHSLVITRRLVATWFDATPSEQTAVFAGQPVAGIIVVRP